MLRHPETNDVIAFTRSVIQQMNYTPVSDAELEKMRDVLSRATHSSNMEGLVAPPWEREFDELRFEMRLPRELYQECSLKVFHHFYRVA